MGPKKGRPDRIRRVESLVQQTVASNLPELLSSSVVVTVTAVEVTPDLRHAIVWFGVTSADSEVAFNELKGLRSQLQHRLSETMTTKFVPRLEFRLDTSGTYADYINRLLRGL